MSVRTNDPRPPEIFKPALCAIGAGCGKPYESICPKCNLAYCVDHLKTPHGCGNWPATRLATPEPDPAKVKEKWPPLDPDTRVRTTSKSTADDEWTPGALMARKWGVAGVIVRHHDAHGLCYDVRHDDGTEGCYDPTEFDICNGGERPQDEPQPAPAVNGAQYAVGQQVAPGLVVIHEETLKRLQGPFTCSHPPEYAGGACAACHAELLEKLDAAHLQNKRLQNVNQVMKALDHLFSDPATHPVVVRRFTGNSQEGVPTIDEGIQRCKGCVDALLSVSDAYFALKLKCPHGGVFRGEKCGACGEDVR